VHLNQRTGSLRRRGWRHDKMPVKQTLSKCSAASTIILTRPGPRGRKRVAWAWARARVRAGGRAYEARVTYAYARSCSGSCRPARCSASCWRPLHRRTQWLHSRSAAALRRPLVRDHWAALRWRYSAARAEGHGPTLAVPPVQECTLSRHGAEHAFNMFYGCRTAGDGNSCCALTAPVVFTAAHAIWAAGACVLLPLTATWAGAAQPPPPPPPPAPRRPMYLRRRPPRRCQPFQALPPTPCASPIRQPT